MWVGLSVIALFRMRSTKPPPVAAVEETQVQFPGIADTTGQLAVVEVLTGSVHSDDKERPSCQ
jgi:hypothetical protein